MIELAPKSNKMTYDEAVLYCHFLEYDGYSDWRMPTFFEVCRFSMTGWYIERIEHTSFDYTTRVQPVRDIC